MKTVIYTPHRWEVSEDDVSKIKSVTKAAVVVVHEENQAISDIRDAEILICFDNNYGDGLLEAGKNLKWIHCLSAGVDLMMTDKMLASDVLLTNSSGVHSIPISEHILGVMLLRVRQFDKAVRQQERKEWNREFAVSELAGKTAVIFGMGNIGLRTARLCKAVGMNVVGVSRSGRPVEGVNVHSVDKAENTLANADYVILTLPLTKDTRHMFGKKEFEKMKGAYFINIGRGAIVDEGALTEALMNGTLAGAALDVFEKEPLQSSSPLWEMPNVFITPHTAGFNPRYMQRAIDIFCRNFDAWQNKEKLPNLVDKEAGY